MKEHDIQQVALLSFTLKMMKLLKNSAAHDKWHQWKGFTSLRTNNFWEFQSLLYSQHYHMYMCVYVYIYPSVLLHYFWWHTNHNKQRWINSAINIYSSAHRHVEYIQQFPSQDFLDKQNLHFQVHVSDKHKHSNWERYISQKKKRGV